MKSLLKHYPIPVALTIIVWLVVGWYVGLSALITLIILTFLEISLSVDNAVVNSRTLGLMSRFWQRLFMTLGIFIAVFLIRFALPIIIVAVSASLGFSDVLNLAVANPSEYGHKLHLAAPMINTFGGIFLLLVALYFFISAPRRDLWLAWPERLLARLNKIPLIKPAIALAVLTLVYLSVSPADRSVVGIAGLVAVGIYLLLHSITLVMEKLNTAESSLHKTGLQALTAFLYLEVLDASFSLDGVIGAFAITDNIFIIIGGLGIGAVWVRTMTLHLVHSKALLRYSFLESGAHWAILLLGLIMLAKLFSIEPPEWVIGSVGLVCVGLSIVSSRKLHKRVKEA